MKKESFGTKIKKLTSLTFYILKNYFLFFLTPHSPQVRYFFTQLYRIKKRPEDREREINLAKTRLQQESQEREIRLRDEDQGRRERLKLEESFYQKKRNYYGHIYQRYLEERQIFQNLNFKQGQWVKVSLKNSKENVIDLWIEVQNHLLAQKWFNLLKKDLDKQTLHLEKNFSFLGLFKHTRRDLNFLCLEMNRYINVINQSGKYYIDLFFGPQILKDKNQHLLNQLHQHFEILIGQIDNISNNFHQSDAPTRFAIKQINQLCHEMEYWLRAEQKYYDVMSGPDDVHVTLQLSFLKTEIYPLSIDEKKLLKLSRDFGQVYLHYCQLGKTHQEAFWDQDQLVGKQNISELQYFSSQFDIDFGPPTLDLYAPEIKSEWNQEEQRSFKNWLKSQGKVLELVPMGRIEVGRLSWGQFETPYLSQIQEKLTEFSDIEKLSIYEDGILSVEQFFPYKESDYGYSELQQSLLLN